MVLPEPLDPPAKVCNVKNMRHIIYICLSLLALSLVSCRKDEGPKPEELAGRAAKIYYEYLRDGKYDAYVDGFYRPDSIPASYREQLIVSAKQYAWQMKEDHKGLDSVGISRAKVDTARHVGHAFLVLHFKDNVHEVIVVPMVQHHGNWMLR